MDPELAHHDRLLADQEEDLGIIQTSLGRVKRISLLINGEIRDQIVLLDRLDNRVGETQERTQTATSHLDKLSQLRFECISMVAVLVAVGLLVILLFLIWSMFQ